MEEVFRSFTMNTLQVEVLHLKTYVSRGIVSKLYLKYKIKSLLLRSEKFPVSVLNNAVRQMH